MFSGGDSSDGINSLNPLGAYGFVNQVAVSNAMAAGQNIDWAQLAQQWIQMRDNSSVEQKTNPSESVNKIIEPSSNSTKFEEKGEADMDMDDEEQTNEDKTTQRVTCDFSATASDVHNSLNQPWLYSEGTPRTETYNQWNAWPNREVLTQSLPNQNIRLTNPTAHIPSLLNITVPNPNELRIIPDISNHQENNTCMMDAAKRKGLPAWIREGLEKMEREKQKQLEKEQQNRDNANLSDEDNTSDKHILAKPLNSETDEALAILDENSTDNENVAITISANNERDANHEQDGNDTCSSPVGKTYEHKLADLMITVRRTLTELLLEATNEEIFSVADETIKTFKSKASSAQVIRKSALSTLTGKLGLADYGDSSSDDDDDEHNSSQKATRQSDSDDSEEEIRNVIRQKRRTFIKISEEIEERVASAAVREEEKLKYFLRLEEEDEREHNRKQQQRSILRDPSFSGHSGHNTYRGYEKDFGEITETKKQHINGKRQRDRSSRKERTTRFSDNKDKFVQSPNAATFLKNMNTVAAAANSGNTNSTVAAVLLNNNQLQNIPDINGLLPKYANAGMTNVLNAADAALKKVLKGKTTSASPEKQSRSHDRDHAPAKKRQRASVARNSRSSCSSTSSSSTSSVTDSSSTSDSSRHSKYSHRSATKHKSHSSADRQYEKSRKDHRHKDGRKYSSSSSYKKRDRESTKSRYHRNGSSDSEDEYRGRHKYDSHYSRNSSHSRSYTSSKRDRDREHSRSQSRSYSSSSNRRQ